MCLDDEFDSFFEKKSTKDNKVLKDRIRFIDSEAYYNNKRYNHLLKKRF